MKTKTLKNRLMLTFLGLVSLTLLFSCQREAIHETQNGDFTVQFLFEQDGCKMYRFGDGGRTVYWANCQGRTQSDYTTQSGKTTVTHHEETITTE